MSRFEIFPYIEAIYYKETLMVKRLLHKWDEFETKGPCMDVLKRHAAMKFITHVIRFFTALLILAWGIFNIILDTEIDICQFAAQLIFVILITIWDIGEPWIYRLLMDIGDCFPGEKYKKVFEDYESLSIENVLVNNAVKNKISGILFFVVYFLLLSLTGLFVKNIIPFWSFILLFVYASISFISTHQGLKFLLFLYHISRPNIIANLEYNQYLPSATYGFYKLNDIAKTLARAFLIIMLIFTVGYALCITPGLIENSATTQMIIQAFFGIALLGWLIHFALVFAPKQYFRKILLTWSYDAIKSKQAQIFTKGIDSATCNRISEEIDSIHSALRPKTSAFEPIMGTLTLLINICGIILSIYS